MATHIRVYISHGGHNKLFDRVLDSRGIFDCSLSGYTVTGGGYWRSILAWLRCAEGRLFANNVAV
jgi:hypothetical protein